jgi:drug/metabolite transporter (DMT)-like permease
MKSTEEINDHNNQLFLIGMVLSMFCWGLSWVSGKVLSGYGDVMSIALFRFAITFVSLLIILLAMKETLGVARKGWLHLVCAALSMALYNYFFFKGLFHGKAGAGGVLATTLNPIISYSIMLLMAWRKPTRTEALGLLIGIFAGAVLLRAWSNWESIFDAGNTYFVLATLTWAVLSLFTARGSRYGSPIAFSLWLYAVAFLTMLLVTSAESNKALFDHGDLYFWGNMFFCAVITTTFATTFYFVATSRLGASKASSFIFMVPFSAALGSWVFLHEVPQWYTVVGGVMGIGAVYVLNRKY